MTYEQLKFHLPIFLMFFSLIVFLWTRIRMRKSVFVGNVENTYLITRVKKVNRIFSILYFVACIKVILYSFFPVVYNSITGPFISWDIPVVNSFGIMIMNISMIWVIVTQMNLDMILLKLMKGRVDGDILERLIVYSEKSLLIGLLIMFLGLFVTISSIATLLLATASIVIYYHFFIKQKINGTPNKYIFF